MFAILSHYCHFYKQMELLQCGGCGGGGGGMVVVLVW